MIYYFRKIKSIKMLSASLLADFDISHHKPKRTEAFASVPISYTMIILSS